MLSGDKKFYICKHCGNIVGKIKDSGVPIVCCGEDMTLLVPGTVDASKEKHVPVATLHNNLVSVKVGSEPHPMEEKHHIAWIYLETKKGGQRVALEVGKPAEAEFSVHHDDYPLAVYEYCNLHGLWKTEEFS
ncbi:MAG: desulfoferrodoxin family protein [Bacillota bacterium]|jgi:superoxide reductase